MHIDKMRTEDGHVLQVETIEYYGFKYLGVSGFDPGASLIYGFSLTREESENLRRLLMDAEDAIAVPG